MSTVRELITATLRLIGVISAGEEVSDADMAGCVYALDSMVDSWSNNSLLVYNYVQQEFNTTGQQSYTLGPGGDWDISRPMKIEKAQARLNSGSAQQVDINMQMLTFKQYADITVKNTSSGFAFALYDDGNYPLRNITLFPIPGSGSKVVLWLRQPLLDLTDIDSVVNYPPGYERAFRYNLAINLAPEYGKVITPEIQQIAISSILNLERNNQYPTYVKGDGGMSLGARNKQFNFITGGFFTMQ